MFDHEGKYIGPKRRRAFTTDASSRGSFRGVVFRPDFPELFAALTAIAYGIWLVCPWDTMPLGASYAFLLSLVDGKEYIWGAIFFAVGACQLYFWRTGSWPGRKSMSAVALFFWTSVYVGFIVGNWRGGATILFPSCLLIHNLTAYLRLGTRART